MVPALGLCQRHRIYGAPTQGRFRAKNWISGSEVARTIWGRELVYVLVSPRTREKSKPYESVRINVI